MLCHQKHALMWGCLESFSDWHSSTTALTTHKFWEPLIFCFWSCSFPLLEKKIKKNQNSHDHFSSWSTNSMTQNLHYIYSQKPWKFLHNISCRKGVRLNTTLWGLCVNPTTSMLLLAHRYMTAEPFIIYWTHLHAGLLVHQWFECT